MTRLALHPKLPAAAGFGILAARIISAMAQISPHDSTTQGADTDVTPRAMAKQETHGLAAAMSSRRKTRT